MWNSRKGIVVLFSLLILFACASSKEEEELFRQKYELAVQSFEKGEYGEAEALFREIISITPSSRVGISSRFMLGLSYYREGKYREAIVQFDDFIRQKLPVDETFLAGYYTANSHFYLKNYFDAARFYLWVMRTENERLKEATRRSLEALLWGYLTVDELHRLRRVSAGQPGEDLISFYIVKRLEAEKAHRLLFEEAQIFLQNYPTSEYSKDVKSMVTNVEQELSKSIIIGVLLPFSGPLAEYGKEIYSGIELAFKDYMRESGKNIVLEKIDTEGDPLVAVVAAKKFLSRCTPVAIIGPLKSESTIGVGLLASEKGIPIITPVASKEGLSKIADGIFQLSPSLEEKSRALATYAFVNLACTTFAVLAPDDEYGKRAGRTFAEKVKELGGTIIGEKYYPEGTMDLTAYLDSIRSPIIKRLSTYTKADSSDTVFYDKRRCLKPPNEWIVHIDGFFLPNYAEELANVLPQIPFNYIDTRFFGAIGWTSQSLVKSSKEYIDGAVFVPDEFYIDTSTPQWKNFSRLYKSAYPEKSEPSRMAALGYDAGKLVVEGLKKKALVPSAMKDFISGISAYEGASGNISFNSYGTNTYVPILRYQGTKITRLR